MVRQSVRGEGSLPGGSGWPGAGIQPPEPEAGRSGAAFGSPTVTDSEPASQSTTVTVVQYGVRVAQAGAGTSECHGAGQLDGHGSWQAGTPVLGPAEGPAVAAAARPRIAGAPTAMGRARPQTNFVDKGAEPVCWQRKKMRFMILHNPEII